MRHILTILAAVSISLTVPTPAHALLHDVVEAVLDGAIRLVGSGLGGILDGMFYSFGSIDFFDSGSKKAKVLTELVLTDELDEGFDELPVEPVLNLIRNSEKSNIRSRRDREIVLTSIMAKWVLSPDFPQTGVPLNRALMEQFPELANAFDQIKVEAHPLTLRALRLVDGLALVALADRLGLPTQRLASLSQLTLMILAEGMKKYQWDEAQSSEKLNAWLNLLHKANPKATQLAFRGIFAPVSQEQVKNISSEVHRKLRVKRAFTEEAHAYFQKITRSCQGVLD